MAEKKNSQVQHEMVEKIESAWEQAAALERKSIEQVTLAIEEGARLMKEALTWQAQINAEWRKLAVDATRRMQSGGIAAAWGSGGEAPGNHKFGAKV